MKFRYFVKNLEVASFEEGKHITQSVRSSGSAFCRNAQRTREDHADARTCQTDTDTSLFSECSSSLAQLFSIDYMHQLSSLYMLNIVASHLLAVESSNIHARN